MYQVRPPPDNPHPEGTVYSSSSTGGPADISGVRLRLLPNVFDVLVDSVGAEEPRTSLILPDDSAIRRLKAFSSAVETLARCFFRGLPKSPSDSSVAGWVGSGPGTVAVPLGGVAERSVAGGVSPEPEPGVSAESPALPPGGSAECWRLSCSTVSKA